MLTPTAVDIATNITAPGAIERGAGKSAAQEEAMREFGEGVMLQVAPRESGRRRQSRQREHVDNCPWAWADWVAVSGACEGREEMVVAAPKVMSRGCDDGQCHT